MKNNEQCNLADWLLAAGLSSNPALLYRDQVLTYDDLRAQVETLAGILQARGFQKGDRIGIYCDNAPFFVVAYLATVRAGMCSVHFPPGTDRKLFETVTEAAQMRCVLVQQKYIQFVQKWSDETSPELLSQDAVTEMAAGSRSQSTLQCPGTDADNDLALLSFTSGSTGIPKAVMVTHRNIQCNSEDIIHYLHLTDQDRVMAVLPLSYCFGLSLLHTHLRVGGSVVLCSSFMFPEKVLDEMETLRCTGFAGVPSTYQILLRKTSFAQRRFSALRYLQQAGGKLPAPMISELIKAQPEVKLFVMYGQTEATARLSYLEPEMLATKLGSIGRGLPTTKLEVLKEDGTPVKPGSDEVGEIVASGPNITHGYWRNPEETARFFVNGRLHTGDLARVDQDGFLYVVDRARDFIKSAGNRISPQEVEEAISTNQDVLHVAVVGVPDELFGEAIAAFIVPRSHKLLDEEQIRGYCNERLPNHKVPQYVYIVDSLPMNEFGKVLKKKLIEQATGRMQV
jgi:acyl-CoA synthetase (AMP-forming)/AMP-acid ligase II